MKIRNHFHKIVFLLYALIFTAALQAQQIRNTYRFYNTLSTSEADCAEPLEQVKGLNQQCQPSTAATPGKFITDNFPLSNITRTVYHNNLNWGLKYLNTNGVISTTYTVQMYIKITNFNKVYTRVIDFSDGVEDNGIYFTNENTPPPANERCLNFYPNGNFGPCPFFNDYTYYLLTITRNDATKLIDIYVNDQLFTSYNDATDFYVSAAGKPVHIFRDDPVGFACEDGEANFAYLSFANYYSSQSDVSAVYNNLNSLIDFADFSVSASGVCLGKDVVVNYSGDIPLNATQYIFNWNWAGANVISGSGRGPYTVNWNTAGLKNIELTISGACNSSFTNTKSLLVNDNIVSRIDTSICKGQTFNGYSLPGKYVDTLKGGSMCDTIRTIQLSNLILQPPRLDAIQTLCKGTSIILSPGDYPKYLWQDGSTKKSFTVTKPGVYTVTVSNRCESSTAEVQVNEIKCKAYFPNAFSPNKDGINETFKILTNYVFAEYHLKVYNRYGENVFESNNSLIGWDGKFKGKDAVSGAYVWYCTFKENATDPLQTMQGTVILLR